MNYTRTVSMCYNKYNEWFSPGKHCTPAIMARLFKEI